MGEPKESDWKTFGSPAHTRNYYRHTRKKTYKEALDELEEKHSQFMKPYVSMDFNAMTHWYPEPDGPIGWDVDPDGSDPLDPETITQNPPPRPGDDREPDEECTCCVTLRLGPCIESSTGKNGISTAEWIGAFNPGVPYGKYTITGDFVKATLKDFKVGPPTLSHWLQWEWDADAVVAAGRTTAYVVLTYEIKGICKQVYDPLFAEDCTACAASGDMTWDSVTSAETIGQSDTAAVAIIGNSGGPYTWTVTGTGYTLTDSVTNGVTNTLNSSASACGGAFIKVTDCAGGTVVGTLRNTDSGDWASCSSGGIGGQTPCNGIHECFDGALWMDGEQCAGPAGFGNTCRTCQARDCSYLTDPVTICCDFATLCTGADCYASGFTVYCQACP